MIEPDNQKLSVRSQCALLQLNRSVYYYQRKPELEEEDILLMDKIDKIYTKFPYYGVPRITRQLHRENIFANHKKVQRLMGIMGLEAIVPKRNLSLPKEGNQIYPYLLKGVIVGFPNHVWGVDITYIKMRNDWLYLFAILDWYSRFVLSWELSDTLSTGFCCQTLEKAIRLHGTPNIHNSDQGSQLTAEQYLNILKKYPSTQISMDGRGRAFDNIFTERLWRTVKYEEVYLKDYSTPKEAKQSLGDYFNLYNNERLHQSLNYQTPAEVYFQKY